MIYNESVLFTKEQIEKVENIKNAKYICTTEHKDKCVEVFYGAEEHPDSGSRYFAFYYSDFPKQLMITDGSFIEDQEISAIIAENGEIIFSRYRHDYRISTDGTVFIDGGRAYTRSSLVDNTRRVTLVVRDGILQVAP